MVKQSERLAFAMALIDLYGSQRKIAAGLAEGPDSVREHWRTLPPSTRERLDEQIDELLARDVDVLLATEPGYPATLRARSGPPLLFTMGDQELLHTRGVGMCGSRHVTDAGLAAARVCGTRVAEEGLTIVSGYAKGVDTETHLAALREGGGTVIVLAEGILSFRVKRTFQREGFSLDSGHAVVVSQFPPLQRWNVGAAMSRNQIIAGLGDALIVIEAGETGGTLDAGKKALEMGQPVIALEFTGGTPPGNEILFRLGAHRAATPGQLAAVLHALADLPPGAPSGQLALTGTGIESRPPAF